MRDLPVDHADNSRHQQLNIERYVLGEILKQGGWTENVHKKMYGKRT
jgi:hypothetical protein